MKNGWLIGVLGLLLALPAGVAAQGARSAVEEANRLYAEGRYAEAHERYLEALREDPESPLIRFNEGNALYQTREFQRALEAYRDALESGDPDLASRAWYNVGNAFYRQQELEASLEAYKQALRADPGDLDAKHNLERVLQQMEENEDDPQESPDQSEQNQDNESEGPSDQQQEPEDQGQDDPDDPSEPDDSGEPPPEQEPPPPPEPTAPPPPGQMSREEAERLLQAIQEDPDEVDRPPRADPLGRRPRKDW